jgi:phage FluMu protein Com
MWPFERKLTREEKALKEQCKKAICYVESLPGDQIDPDQYIEAWRIATQGVPSPIAAKYEEAYEIVTEPFYFAKDSVERRRIMVKGFQIIVDNPRDYRYDPAEVAGFWLCWPVGWKNILETAHKRRELACRRVGWCSACDRRISAIPMSEILQLMSVDDETAIKGKATRCPKCAKLYCTGCVHAAGRKCPNCKVDVEEVHQVYRWNRAKLTDIFNHGFRCGANARANAGLPLSEKNQPPATEKASEYNVPLERAAWGLGYRFGYRSGAADAELASVVEPEAHGMVSGWNQKKLERCGFFKDILE